MKKKILICFIILFLVLSNFSFKYATLRTENDLQIWEDIQVDEDEKEMVLKTPKVDETKKIYDNANLLSNSEEKILFTRITEFIKKYNMDMIIVTINYNDKLSPKKYAQDFYNYNYFGVGQNHDGMLLLIDMNYKTALINVNGEVSKIYDEAKLNDILNSLTPSLKNANYYLTILKFINTTENYLELEKAQLEEKNNTFDIIYILEMIFVPTIGTIVFIFIGIQTHKSVKKSTIAKKYLKEPSLNVTFRKDELVKTATTKILNKI